MTSTRMIADSLGLTDAEVRACLALDLDPTSYARRRRERLLDHDQEDPAMPADLPDLTPEETAICAATRMDPRAYAALKATPTGRGGGRSVADVQAALEAAATTPKEDAR